MIGIGKVTRAHNLSSVIGSGLYYNAYWPTLAKVALLVRTFNLSYLQIVLTELSNCGNAVGCETLSGPG